MPSLEKVPGFLVVPNKNNSEKSLVFDIWITEGSISSPFFFTSPSAREAISKFPSHGLARSTHIGEINYSFAGELSEKMKQKYKTKNNPVFLYELFPYLSHMERNEGIRNQDRFFFENKGIALNLERITLRELLKVSPKAYLAPTGFFSELRESQLIRRGMNVTSARQMFSARQSLQAINRHIKQHKIKNRLSFPNARLRLAQEANKRLRVRRRK
jgi:hypothetical protein